MPTLQVDSLTFAFQAQVSAQRYDQWQHYLQVWNNPQRHQKALDVVAVEPAATPAVTWLIEARDFRVITTPPRPSKISGLAQIIAEKTFHTLNGLSDASAHGAQLLERNHAALALSSPIRRVVLHLEPHAGQHTKLFPIGFAAGVLQKLRQLVRAVDHNPLVLSIAITPTAGVPWTVS